MKSVVIDSSSPRAASRRAMGPTSMMLSEVGEEASPCRRLACWPEQWLAPRQRLAQRRDKTRFALEPQQKPREHLGVADREIAGIVGAEQADIAVDARRKHWHTSYGRLRDDIGAAFIQRGDDHGVAARQQPPHGGGGNIVPPL